MNHRLIPCLCALVALAILAPLSDARADNCNLRFDNVSDPTFDGSGGRGYDPFARSNGLTAVDFTIRNKKKSSCAFFVTVSTGQAGSYNRVASNGGATIRYNIYGGPSAGDLPLHDISDATRTTVLSGFLDGKETISLRYYLDVPALQIVAQGNYTDTVEFGLYSGSQNEFEREDDENVRITVPVIPVIDVEIAAGGVRLPLEGASVVLDFGNLQPRASRDFNLYVRGNAPYRVEIESENRGVLRLDAFATDHNTIPYELSIDGGRRSLNQPIMLSYGTLISGARDHRGRITIGDFDTVLRGTYSDVLTISVTAN
jgi:hypothetical protein